MALRAEGHGGVEAIDGHGLVAVGPEPVEGGHCCGGRTDRLRRQLGHAKGAGVDLVGALDAEVDPVRFGERRRRRAAQGIRTA
jgi:hypothetical protein